MGMHVPWLQVTQETWDLANQFAGLTGVTFQEAFTGIIEAFRWGVSLGPETEPPMGVCESPRALDRLAAVMRLLKIDRQLLAEVMVDLGIIELLPIGLRIRGTKRYWPTWKKNNEARWKEWEAAHANLSKTLEETAPPVSARNPTGTGPEPARDRPVPEHQIQIQTQKHIKEPPPPTPSVGTLALVAPTSVCEVVEGQRLWRTALPEGMWGLCQELRLSQGLAAEEKPDDFDAWHAEVMRDYGPDAGALAYRAYLQDDHFAPKGWPTSIFLRPKVWPSRIGARATAAGVRL